MDEFWAKVLDITDDGEHLHAQETKQACLPWLPLFTAAVWAGSSNVYSHSLWEVAKLEMPKHYQLQLCWEALLLSGASTANFSCALTAGNVAAIQAGMQRLLETGSWTRYRWKNHAPLDSESFR